MTALHAHAGVLEIAKDSCPKSLSKHGSSRHRFFYALKREKLKK